MSCDHVVKTCSADDYCPKCGRWLHGAKEGDILWRMVSNGNGSETIWRAECKKVVKVDKNRNHAFFFADGTGASQISLGRTYFRSKEETEQEFMQRWPGELMEDGGYKAELPLARTSVRQAVKGS